MNIDEYNDLPKEKKVEMGDLISFYFPAKGSLQETGLIALNVFETMSNGNRIVMVRATGQPQKEFLIFKGKANFDYSSFYDLDYVTIEKKFKNGK